MSSSQGTTSKVTPAGLEDADVSSAGPEDEHSAASLRERHISEQAGRRLRFVPIKKGSTYAPAGLGAL